VSLPKKRVLATPEEDIFLKRDILPGQCRFVSLAEICPNFAEGVDQIVEQKYLPSPLNEGSLLCRDMIAVARRRDE